MARRDAQVLLQWKLHAEFTKVLAWSAQIVKPETTLASVELDEETKRVLRFLHQ